MGKDIGATLKLAGLLAVLFLAYLFRGALVEPPSVDPAHAFNTQRAFERLTRILGDEVPHSVDSAANDAVISRLITEITALGLTPILTDQPHCKRSGSAMICARIQNIAFWVTEPGPNAVLLLSHHDSVPAGPGASDDGSGVAASLEIAHLMASRTLSRPLLVLITDGEELGLMGANMFVETDPLAQMVGAVVNMEARGVSGLSALIQTSRPNGRDLKTLASATRLPAASSINADIYELLPNDTDMTEFLSLPVDAANLAYAGDVAFYHTPGDTLANMDQRSLFNMGASGLAATEAFLAQTGQEAEAQRIYVDILGRFMLILPLWLGGAFIILGGLLALILLWRERTQTQAWRVLLLPPLALALGIGLALGANWLIGMIRLETLFGSAYPIALRGLHGASALTGAMFIYTFLARPDERKALLTVSWIWTSLLGLAAFILLPGAAILFAPSLAIFAGASLLFMLGREPLGYILAALGAFVFALIALPLTALGESGLFIEASAPFTIILVLLFSFTVPLIWPAADALLRSFWIALTGSAVTMAAFLIAALFVPAYSADTPRGLSITHIQSASLDQPYWSISGREPAPSLMLDLFPFETAGLEIFGGPRQIAPAPGFPDDMQANIRKDTISEDVRTLEIEVLSDQTDRLSISFSASNPTSGIAFNGDTVEDSSGLRAILCSGRTCRRANITVSFPSNSEDISIDIVSTRFGLGSEGTNLLKARPDWTIPKQNGDTRLAHIRLMPGNKIQE